MKALTLTQPWAALLAIGEKRFETRSWGTSYRGPLAIHAAKGLPAWAREVFYEGPFREVLHRHYGPGYLDRLEAQRGCVIATCRLGDVVRMNQRLIEQQTPQELEFGDWSPGRFAWSIDDVRPLPSPMAERGALGLWELRVL